MVGYGKNHKCKPIDLLKSIDKRKPPKTGEAANSERQRVKRILRNVGRGTGGKVRAKNKKGGWKY